MKEIEILVNGERYVRADCLKADFFIDGEKLKNWQDENAKEAMKPDTSHFYFKPEDGEDYWFSTCSCESWDIHCTTGGECLDEEKRRVEQGNCFPTSELAEKELERRKALVRIKKYIVENGLYFEPVWDNKGATGHHVCYDYVSNEFVVTAWSGIKHITPFFFKFHTHAQQVIDNCKDDLLKIFDLK